jgi:DNA-binding MarR family transcriptional regulator
MEMTKLSTSQRDVLRLLYEHGSIGGTCIRYEWTFNIGSDHYTRQVRALERKGLVDVMYFSGGRAAVNLTEAGRAALPIYFSDVELHERRP